MENEFKIKTRNMKKGKITNMGQLTSNLSENYSKLCNGDLEATKAKEISNMAGKIISSCRTQIEYNKLIKSKKKIAFLESR